MMIDVMGEILPFALAAALTPTAILAGLLFLLTRSPRHAGGAYLAGWVLGLLVSAFVLLRLGSLPAGGGIVQQEPLFRTGTLVLAGVALIISGVLTIRSRRQASGEPPWMRRVDGLSPAHAAGLGFVLAGLSPKVLILTAAAVTAILLTGGGPSQNIFGLGLYVLLASLPIAVPVVVIFAEGERGTLRIQAWKSWLFLNQGWLLGGCGILLGLLLIGRAVSLAGGP